MSEIRIEIQGLDRQMAALRAKVDAADAAAKPVARRLALEWIQRAKLFSTGPARTGGPRRTRSGATISHRAGGPGVVTGAHRNSIAVKRELPSGVHGWQVLAGPGRPYSRRLELGFDGPDSLGRVYHQPPYPYAGPALAWTEARAHSLASSIWGDAIRAA